MAGTRGSLVALAEEWLSLWSADGPLERFEALHAESFVDHSAAGRATDRAGFRAGIVRLLEAFPDLETRLEDVVVDEPTARMAIRWSSDGTFQRPYLGCDPTGRRITFGGIEIVAVRDGRITDRWGEWDGLDLLAQLRGGA